MGRISSQFVLARLCCSVAGIGCAKSLKETEPELEARLFEIGKKHIRGLQEPRVFPIHAETRTEAIKLLADARAKPRYGLSLDLAEQFVPGKESHVHYIVGGPFADLNEQIVSNALDYQESALRGLVVVFVSPDPPAAELGALALRKLVQVIHLPLELPDA